MDIDIFTEENEKELDMVFTYDDDGVTWEDKIFGIQKIECVGKYIIVHTDKKEITLAHKKILNMILTVEDKEDD